MKISKYRVIIATIILAAITVTGFTQVNEAELNNLPPVVFLNYEGPHAVENTREEIRQIGVVLGRQIEINEQGNAPVLAGMTAQERRQYSYLFNTGGLNRYSVLHIFSGEEDGRLNADIMSLGVDVAVDHIRNLRVIIQGYLQAAYNYNAADALLLAEFVTVYNAVYRGNWNYFTDRYKTQVMGNLLRERVGLSIRYDEWPGRTQIVIPLGRGGLSSVNTSVISDMLVIDELRKEANQGIPQRRALVDLMEREAEEAEQQAQIIREEVRQEERQIAEERTEIAQERQQIAQERQQVQEQQQQGTITQEQAARAEQELERREAAVEQREQELERREEIAEDRREEAQALEDYAAEIVQEAQEQRWEIVADQQAGIENPVQAAAIAQEITGGVYGVSINSLNPAAIGQIIRYNPVNGTVLVRSANNTIHARTVQIISGRIFAISGGAQGVRLTEVNPNTLEVIKYGNDDIRAGSLLWVNGNDLYAITTESGNCYLGRFNLNLELQVKSIERIHTDASVTFQQGRLLTQRPDGSPMALNPADLTLLW